MIAAWRPPPSGPGGNAAGCATYGFAPRGAGPSGRVRVARAAGDERRGRGRRYNWFGSRGLFVGSDVVEAGCKAVIGLRLKLSGMRWTVADADAIAALRCQQASRPEDQIWYANRNQTSAA